MSTSKKIWLGISIAIVVIFLWGIPLGMYESSSFFFSGAGAVLLFVSLFLFFGEFTSLDEIFEKHDKSVPQPAGRNIAPFMVLPAFIFLFISFFYYSNKKSNALETNGVLAKGIVLNGESTQTTRRMRTTTSYELQIEFTDSAGTKYYFYPSVSSSEFNDVYQGAPVDVVYWREDPNVAKAIFNMDELSKYKKVPDNPITIANLTAILDGKVNQDSIRNYLNTINYEWTYGNEERTYENLKLKQAVRYSEESGTVAFVETNHMMGQIISQDGKPVFSFDNDLIEKGYKKQASSGENGEAVELFYTDNYVVQKTTKLEQSQGNGFGMNAYTIYLVAKVSAATVDQAR